MRDEILEFRSLVKILVSDHGYNTDKVCADSGLSWPTVSKLLKAPPEEIKLQASVLARLQDFHKKHKDKIAYAGIKPEEILPEPEKKTLRMPEDALTGKGISYKDPKKSGPIEPVNPDPVNPDFWEALKLLHKHTPGNVKVVLHLTINPEK